MSKQYYLFKKGIKDGLEDISFSTLWDLLESWISQNDWMAIIFIIFLVIIFEIVLIKFCTWFQKKPVLSENSSSNNQENEDSHLKSVRFALDHWSIANLPSEERVHVFSERTISSSLTSEENEGNFEDRVSSSDEIIWTGSSGSEYQVSHFSERFIQSSSGTISSLSLFHSELKEVFLSQRECPEDEYDTIQFSSKKLFSIMKTKKNTDSILSSDLNVSRIPSFTAENEDLEAAPCSSAHFHLSRDQVRLLEETVRSQIPLKSKTMLESRAIYVYSSSQESSFQHQHSGRVDIAAQPQDFFSGQNAIQNQDFYETQFTGQPQQFVHNQELINNQPIKARFFAQPQDLMRKPFFSSIEESFQVQNMDRSQYLAQIPYSVETQDSIKTLETDRNHLGEAQYSVRVEDSNKYNYSIEEQNTILKNAEFLALTGNSYSVAEETPQLKSKNPKEQQQITSSKLSQYSSYSSVPFLHTNKRHKCRGKTSKNKKLNLKIKSLKAKKTPTSRLFQIIVHKRKGTSTKAFRLICVSKLLPPYIEKHPRRKLEKVMLSLTKCRQNVEKISDAFQNATETTISEPPAVEIHNRLKADASSIGQLSHSTVKQEKLTDEEKIWNLKYVDERCTLNIFKNPQQCDEEEEEQEVLQEAVPQVTQDFRFSIKNLKQKPKHVKIEIKKSSLGSRKTQNKEQKVQPQTPFTKTILETTLCPKMDPFQVENVKQSSSRHRDRECTSDGENTLTMPENLLVDELLIETTVCGVPFGRKSRKMPGGHITKEKEDLKRVLPAISLGSLNIHMLTFLKFRRQKIRKKLSGRTNVLSLKSVITKVKKPSISLIPYANGHSIASHRKKSGCNFKIIIKQILQGKIVADGLVNVIYPHRSILPNIRKHSRLRADKHSHTKLKQEKSQVERKESYSYSMNKENASRNTLESRLQEERIKEMQQPTQFTETLMVFPYTPLMDPFLIETTMKSLTTQTDLKCTADSKILPPTSGKSLNGDVLNQIRESDIPDDGGYTREMGYCCAEKKAELLKELLSTSRETFNFCMPVLSHFKGPNKRLKFAHLKSTVRPKCVLMKAMKPFISQVFDITESHNLGHRKKLGPNFRTKIKKKNQVKELVDEFLNSIYYPMHGRLGAETNWFCHAQLQHRKLADEGRPWYDEFFDTNTFYVREDKVQNKEEEEQNTFVSRSKRQKNSLKLASKQSTVNLKHRALEAKKPPISHVLTGRHRKELLCNFKMKMKDPQQSENIPDAFLNATHSMVPTFPNTKKSNRLNMETDMQRITRLDHIQLVQEKSLNGRKVPYSDEIHKSSIYSSVEYGKEEEREHEALPTAENSQYFRFNAYQKDHEVVKSVEELNRPGNTNMQVQPRTHFTQTSLDSTSSPMLDQFQLEKLEKCARILPAKKGESKIDEIIFPASEWDIPSDGIHQKEQDCGIKQKKRVTFAFCQPPLSTSKKKGNFKQFSDLKTSVNAKCGIIKAKKPSISYVLNIKGGGSPNYRKELGHNSTTKMKEMHQSKEVLDKIHSFMTIRPDINMHSNTEIEKDVLGEKRLSSTQAKQEISSHEGSIPSDDTEETNLQDEEEEDREQETLLKVIPQHSQHFIFCSGQKKGLVLHKSGKQGNVKIPFVTEQVETQQMQPTDPIQVEKPKKSFQTQNGTICTGNSKLPTLKSKDSLIDKVLTDTAKCGVSTDGSHTMESHSIIKEEKAELKRNLQATILEPLDFTTSDLSESKMQRKTFPCRALKSKMKARKAPISQIRTILKSACLRNLPPKTKKSQIVEFLMHIKDSVILSDGFHRRVLENLTSEKKERLAHELLATIPKSFDISGLALLESKKERRKLKLTDKRNKMNPKYITLKAKKVPFSQTFHVPGYGTPRYRRQLEGNFKTMMKQVKFLVDLFLSAIFSPMLVSLDTDTQNRIKGETGILCKTVPGHDLQLQEQLPNEERAWCAGSSDKKDSTSDGTKDVKDQGREEEKTACLVEATPVNSKHSCLNAYKMKESNFAKSDLQQQTPVTQMILESISHTILNAFPLEEPQDGTVTQKSFKKTEIPKISSPMTRKSISEFLIGTTQSDIPSERDPRKELASSILEEKKRLQKELQARTLESSASFMPILSESEEQKNTSQLGTKSTLSSTRVTLKPKTPSTSQVLSIIRSVNPRHRKKHKRNFEAKTKETQREKSVSGAFLKSCFSSIPVLPDNETCNRKETNMLRKVRPSHVPPTCSINEGHTLNDREVNMQEEEEEEALLETFPFCTQQSMSSEDQKKELDLVRSDADFDNSGNRKIKELLVREQEVQQQTTLIETILESISCHIKDLFQVKTSERDINTQKGLTYAKDPLIPSQISEESVIDKPLPDTTDKRCEGSHRWDPDGPNIEKKAGTLILEPSDFSMPALSKPKGKRNAEQIPKHETLRAEILSILETSNITKFGTLSHRKEQEYDLENLSKEISQSVSDICMNTYFSPPPVLSGIKMLKKVKTEKNQLRRIRNITQLKQDEEKILYADSSDKLSIISNTLETKWQNEEEKDGREVLSETGLQFLNTGNRTDQNMLISEQEVQQQTPVSHKGGTDGTGLDSLRYGKGDVFMEGQQKSFLKQEMQKLDLIPETNLESILCPTMKPFHLKETIETIPKQDSKLSTPQLKKELKVTNSPRGSKEQQLQIPGRKAQQQEPFTGAILESISSYLLDQLLTEKPKEKAKTKDEVLKGSVQHKKKISNNIYMSNVDPMSKNSERLLLLIKKQERKRKKFRKKKELKVAGIMKAAITPKLLLQYSPAGAQLINTIQNADTFKQRDGKAHPTSVSYSPMEILQIKMPRVRTTLKTVDSPMFHTSNTERSDLCIAGKEEEQPEGIHQNFPKPAPHFLMDTLPSKTPCVKNAPEDIASITDHDPSVEGIGLLIAEKVIQQLEWRHQAFSKPASHSSVDTLQSQTPCVRKSSKDVVNIIDHKLNVEGISLLIAEKVAERLQWRHQAFLKPAFHCSLDTLQSKTPCVRKASEGGSALGHAPSAEGTGLLITRKETQQKKCTNKSLSKPSSHSTIDLMQINIPKQQRKLDDMNIMHSEYSTPQDKEALKQMEAKVGYTQKSEKRQNHQQMSSSYESFLEHFFNPLNDPCPFQHIMLQAKETLPEVSKVSNGAKRLDLISKDQPNPVCEHGLKWLMPSNIPKKTEKQNKILPLESCNKNTKYWNVSFPKGKKSPDGAQIIESISSGSPPKQRLRKKVELYNANQKVPKEECLSGTFLHSLHIYMPILPEYKIQNNIIQGNKKDIIYLKRRDLKLNKSVFVLSHTLLNADCSTPSNKPKLQGNIKEKTVDMKHRKGESNLIVTKIHESTASSSHFILNKEKIDRVISNNIKREKQYTSQKREKDRIKADKKGRAGPDIVVWKAKESSQSHVLNRKDLQLLLDIKRQESKGQEGKDKSGVPLTNSCTSSPSPNFTSRMTVGKNKPGILKDCLPPLKLPVSPSVRKISYVESINKDFLSSVTKSKQLLPQKKKEDRENVVEMKDLIGLKCITSKGKKAHSEHMLHGNELQWNAKEREKMILGDRGDRGLGLDKPCASILSPSHGKRGTGIKGEEDIQGITRFCFPPLKPQELSDAKGIYKEPTDDILSNIKKAKHRQQKDKDRVEKALEKTMNSKGIYLKAKKSSLSRELLLSRKEKEKKMEEDSERIDLRAKKSSLLQELQLSSKEKEKKLKDDSKGIYLKAKKSSLSQEWLLSSKEKEMSEADSKGIYLKAKKSLLSHELLLSRKEKEKKLQEDKYVGIQSTSCASISFPPYSELDIRTRGEEATLIKTRSSFLQLKLQETSDIGKIACKESICCDISNSVKKAKEYVMQEEEKFKMAKVRPLIRKKSPISQKFYLDPPKQEKKTQKIKVEPNVVLTKPSTSIPPSHLTLDIRMKNEKNGIEITRHSFPKLSYQKSSDAVRIANKETIQDDITSDVEKTKEFMQQKEEGREIIVNMTYMMHPRGTTSKAKKLPLSHVCTIANSGGTNTREVHTNIKQGMSHKQERKSELDEVLKLPSLSQYKLDTGIQGKEHKQGVMRSFLPPPRHVESSDSGKPKYRVTTVNDISRDLKRTKYMTEKKEDKIYSAEKGRMHHKYLSFKAEKSPLSYILNTKELQLNIKEQEKKGQDGKGKTVVILSKAYAFKTLTHIKGDTTKKEKGELGIIKCSVPRLKLQEALASGQMASTQSIDTDVLSHVKKRKHLPQKEENSVTTLTTNGLIHPKDIVFKEKTSPLPHVFIIVDDGTLRKRKEQQWSARVKVEQEHERERKLDVVLPKAHLSMPSTSQHILDIRIKVNKDWLGMAGCSPSQVNLHISSDAEKSRNEESNEGISLHNVILKADQQMPNKEATDKIKLEDRHGILLPPKISLKAKTSKFAYQSNKKKLPLNIKKQVEKVKGGKSEPGMGLRKAFASLPSHSPCLKRDPGMNEKERMRGVTRSFPLVKIQNSSELGKKACTESIDSYKPSKRKAPMQSIPKLPVREGDKVKIYMEEKKLPKRRYLKAKKSSLSNIPHIKELQWKTKEQERKVQEDKSELVTGLTNICASVLTMQHLKSDTTEGEGYRIKITRFPLPQLKSKNSSDAEIVACPETIQREFSNGVKEIKEQMLQKEKKDRGKTVAKDGVGETSEMYLKAKESPGLHTHNMDDLHWKTKETMGRVQEHKGEPHVGLAKTCASRSFPLHLQANTRIKEEGQTRLTRSSYLQENCQEPSHSGKVVFDEPIICNILINLKKGQQQMPQKEKEDGVKQVNILTLPKYQEKKGQVYMDGPGVAQTKPSTLLSSLPHLKLNKETQVDDEMLQISLSPCLKRDTGMYEKKGTLRITESFPLLKIQSPPNLSKKIHTESIDGCMLSKRKGPMQSTTQEEEGDTKIDMEDKILPKCKHLKRSTLPHLNTLNIKELQWKAKQQERKVQEDKNELIMGLTNICASVLTLPHLKSDTTGEGCRTKITRLPLPQLKSNNSSEAEKVAYPEIIEGEFSYEKKELKEQMLQKVKKESKTNVAMNGVGDTTEKYSKAKESLILHTHNPTPFQWKTKEPTGKVQKHEGEPHVGLTKTCTSRSFPLHLQANTKIKEEGLPKLTRFSFLQENCQESTGSGKAVYDASIAHEIVINMKKGKQCITEKEKGDGVKQVGILKLPKLQEKEVQVCMDGPGVTVTKPSTLLSSPPHLKLNKEIQVDNEMVCIAGSVWPTISNAGKIVSSESIDSGIRKGLKKIKQHMPQEEGREREKAVDRRDMLHLTDITLKTKKSPPSNMLHRTEVHLNIKRQEKKEQKGQGEPPHIVLRKIYTSKPSPPTLNSDKGTQVDEKVLGIRGSSLPPLMLPALSVAKKTVAKETIDGDIRKGNQQMLQKGVRYKRKTVDIRLRMHCKDAEISPISPILNAKEFVLNSKKAVGKVHEGKGGPHAVRAKTFLSIPPVPSFYVDLEIQMDKDTPGITGSSLPQQKLEESSGTQKLGKRASVDSDSEDKVKKAEYSVPHKEAAQQYTSNFKIIIRQRKGPPLVKSEGDLNGLVSPSQDKDVCFTGFGTINSERPGWLFTEQKAQPEKHKPETCIKFLPHPITDPTKIGNLKKEAKIMDNLSNKISPKVSFSLSKKISKEKHTIFGVPLTTRGQESSASERDVEQQGTLSKASPESMDTCIFVKPEKDVPNNNEVSVIFSPRVLAPERKESSQKMKITELNTLQNREEQEIFMEKQVMQVSEGEHETGLKSVLCLNSPLLDGKMTPLEINVDKQSTMHLGIVILPKIQVDETEFDATRGEKEEALLVSEQEECVRESLQKSLYSPSAFSLQSGDLKEKNKIDTNPTVNTEPKKSGIGNNSTMNQEEGKLKMDTNRIVHPEEEKTQIYESHAMNLEKEKIKMGRSNTVNMDASSLKAEGPQIKTRAITRITGHCPVSQKHKKELEVFRAKQNTEQQKLFQRNTLGSFYAYIPLSSIFGGQKGRLRITDLKSELSPKHLTVKVSNHPISQILSITGHGTPSNRKKFEYNKQKKMLLSKDASGIFIRSLSIYMMSPPHIGETVKSQTRPERVPIDLSKFQEKSPNASEILRRDSSSMVIGVPQELIRPALQDAQSFVVDEQQTKTLLSVNSEANLSSEINGKKLTPQPKETVVTGHDASRIIKERDLRISEQEEEVPEPILTPKEHSFISEEPKGNVEAHVENNVNMSILPLWVEKSQCEAQLFDTMEYASLSERGDQNETEEDKTTQKVQQHTALPEPVPKSLCIPMPIPLQIKSNETKILDSTSAKSSLPVHEESKNTLESRVKNMVIERDQNFLSQRDEPLETPSFAFVMIQDKVSADKMENIHTNKPDDLMSPPFAEGPDTTTLYSKSQQKPYLKDFTTEEKRKLFLRVKTHLESKALEIKLNLIPEIVNRSFQKFKFHPKQPISDKENCWGLYPRYKDICSMSPEGIDTAELNLKPKYQKDSPPFGRVKELLVTVSRGNAEIITNLRRVNKLALNGTSSLISADTEMSLPHILQNYTVKEKDRLFMHFSMKTLEIQMKAFPRIVGESYAIASARDRREPLSQCTHSGVKAPKRRNNILLFFEEKSLRQIDLDLQYKYLRFLLGSPIAGMLPKPNALPKHNLKLSTSVVCKKVDGVGEKCGLPIDTELLEQHISFKKQSPHENSSLMREFLEPTPVCASDRNVQSMVLEVTKVLPKVKPLLTPEKNKEFHLWFQEPIMCKSADVETQGDAVHSVGLPSVQISEKSADIQANTESPIDLEEDEDEEYIFLEANPYWSQQSQRIHRKAFPLENFHKKKKSKTGGNQHHSEDSGSRRIRGSRKHSLVTTPPSYKTHKNGKYRSSTKTQSPDWLCQSSRNNSEIQSGSSSVSFAEDKCSGTTRSRTSYSLAPLTESNIKLHFADNQGKTYMHLESKERKKPTFHVFSRNNVHLDDDYSYTQSKKKRSRKKKVYDYESGRSEHYFQSRHKSASKPHHENTNFYSARKPNQPFYYACVPADSLEIIPKTIRWTIPTETLRKRNFRIPLVANISSSWNIWSSPKKFLELLSESLGLRPVHEE